MNDILYLKIEQNVVVHKNTVILKDVASLFCTNDTISNALKNMKIHIFQEQKGKKKKKPQIEVFSILKIIQLITKEYPNLKIQNMGEEDFILEYIPQTEAKWFGITKAILICILIFFGSAFTIMTFNNDAGVGEVFDRFYEQVMGKESSGFGILEVTYSLGLGVGILIFFNHVGSKKVTHDPTPIQVQMRKYEQDVDTTFIENCSRKGTNIDVD